MVDTFPSIKIGLMVGIGGGVPPTVKLGDVVVSTPAGPYPGVVQWDFGKAKESGEFEQIGVLDNPPRVLLTALSKLETEHEMNGSKISQYLDELEEKWKRLVPRYSRPPSTQDASTTDNHEVVVHYGLIASGNQVIKDAALRDSLNDRYGGKLLCVEMEAAGLLNFPSIVIRGIFDYADSKKSDDWQEYAATVAAAFAKELLRYVQPSEVSTERLLRDMLGSS
jgi:nucleoside phosphorylase